MSLLRSLFFGLVLLFLCGPLIVIAGVSVNERRLLLFPPEGFSLHWYAELFSQAEWLRPTLTSLLIATLAAALAVTIAMPLAYGLWRYRTRYGALLYGLGLMPFMLPPVITALGFLVFWATLGLYGALASVVISHGVFLATLPLATISLGLRGIDREMIEASVTMGADNATVFRTVVLPLVMPYVIAGYAFAFVLSLNEYIIAYMVAGFTVETLPIKIFNSLRYGYTPVMAAVAVVFVFLAVVIFGLVGRFGDLPRLLGAYTKGED